MLMKPILGLALLLVAAQVQAQTVETEMTKLKQLAENCLASISTKSCNVTTACDVFRSYSKELMPDGPAGYYDLHVPDKSMNLENGTLVRDAVKAASKANKTVEKCIST